MQCHRMKVWRPDGTLTSVNTIACSEDYLGNRIAEGDMLAEEYWPRLADHYKRRARSFESDLARSENNLARRLEAERSRIYAEGWIARWLDYTSANRPRLR